MQHRRLGKSELKISPILMGTWQAGKEMWVGIDDALPYCVTNDITILAWVISHAGACAIAGARSPDQAVQNAAAADRSVSDDDLARLDEIGRLVTDYLDDDQMMWNF